MLELVLFSYPTVPGSKLGSWQFCLGLRSAGIIAIIAVCATTPGFLLLLETGSCYVAQDGLDPPASGSLRAVRLSCAFLKQQAGDAACLWMRTAGALPSCAWRGTCEADRVLPLLFLPAWLPKEPCVCNFRWALGPPRAPFPACPALPGSERWSWPEPFGSSGVQPWGFP